MVELLIPAFSRSIYFIFSLINFRNDPNDIILFHFLILCSLRDIVRIKCNILFLQYEQNHFAPLIKSFNMCTLNKTFSIPTCVFILIVFIAIFIFFLDPKTYPHLDESYDLAYLQSKLLSPTQAYQKIF